jgi:hypothetical protein
LTDTTQCDESSKTLDKKHQIPRLSAKEEDSENALCATRRLEYQINLTKPTKADQDFRTAELLGSETRPRTFLPNKYRQLAAYGTD